MYNVYVLRSLKNKKRYVGYTSKNPEVRLKEHNNGQSAFTSRNCPHKLLYFESFEDKKYAIIRERFLKSDQGRKFLDELGLPM